MTRHSLVYLVSLAVLAGCASPQTAPPPSAAPSPAPSTENPDPAEENPEGYYAFMESPNATPPRVRPPPYRQVAADCPEAESPRPHVSASNLCGDLNRGTIPRNPMGQNPNGEPYPFELLRNHTLRFLSRTLPVLKADDTVPRVAHIGPHIAHNRLEERSKRSAEPEVSELEPDSVPSHALPAEHRAADSPRESRKFCDEGGVFCMLYRAFNGASEPAAVERREDPGHAAPVLNTQHRYEGPPTPCPARVEYATPVFARNYQGVWRYVVQIPYEGYFTQTVEVTRSTSSISRTAAALERSPSPAPRSRRTATDTTTSAASRCVCTTTGSWCRARASVGDQTTSRGTCDGARIITNCKVHATSKSSR